MERAPEKAVERPMERFPRPTRKRLPRTASGPVRGLQGEGVMKLSARELELREKREAEYERQQELLAKAMRKPVSTKPSVSSIAEFNAASTEFNKSHTESNKSQVGAVEFNKPGFDRVAYQRDYMRRKRHADRALKQAERGASR